MAKSNTRSLVGLGAALIAVVIAAAGDAEARPQRRNPYMSLSNFTLNGRSNEAMYPREEIVIGMTVGNVGAQPTAGGTLVIESVQGPAEAMRATVEIPALASGERAELRAPETALSLRVSPAALASEAVTVMFKWTTREGFEGSMTRDFRIIRGQLSVVGVDFGNPQQPEEGGIQPGGEGDIYLTVANTGNEAMRDIAAMPEGMTCAVARSGEVRVAALAPGERMRIATPLRVGVPANCPNGSAANMRLTGDYNGEFSMIPVNGELTFYSGVTTYYERETTFDPPVFIPDVGPVVMGTLNVDAMGFYTDVAVTVNLQHTFIGDIRVSIQHPDGTEVVLHNQTGGGTNDILQTYGTGGTPIEGLAALMRKRSEGAWMIKVVDLVGGDTGHIIGLKLRFRGYTTESRTEE